MPARMAGSRGPTPPRSYPDSPDPDVRFAHIPSPTARQIMAERFPLTEEPEDQMTTTFPIETQIKDPELGRREPKWAHALPDEMRRQDDDVHEVKAREYVRPSDARKCSRQLGYVACGAEITDPMDDASIVATTVGKYLHRMWQDGMEKWFEEMRADYMAEHGELARPAVGVPWRIEIEKNFNTTITLPDGIEVPIIGFADLIVYDAYDTVLEVDDAKSITGFSFKKKLKEGVESGPWVQSWIYAVIEGAEDVAVLNLGKENISVKAAAGMRDVSSTERYGIEFVKPARELDALGYKELRRMWGINRLAHEAGMLPLRTIPEYGGDTEIIAPGTGLFENGTTAWQCVGYCAYQQQCITDGPGRVPIPETSVLAISRRQATDKLAETFPGATEVQS